MDKKEINKALNEIKDDVNSESFNGIVIITRMGDTLKSFRVGNARDLVSMLEQVKFFVLTDSGD